MKLLFALLAMFVCASGEESVYIDSGYVVSLRTVTHGQYTHTVLHFTITSSGRPIPVVIWLYNDEKRLKVGDHVRLERRLYGTDEGVKEIDQCFSAKPEAEPCTLMEIVGIRWLSPEES